MKDDVTSGNTPNGRHVRGLSAKGAPLTSAEKRLIVACVLFVALVGWALITWDAMNRNPVVTVPTPAPINPNARDFYVKAAEQIVDQRYSEYFKPSPPPSVSGQQANAQQQQKIARQQKHPLTLPEKDEVLAKDASALQTLRQAFTYPYAEIPSRSLGQLYPHFGQIRELAFLLKFEAEVKVAHGDWGGSVDSTLDAIHMGTDLPHGGAFMSMLVGIFAQSTGRQPVWTAIGHLNAQQARAAAQRLQGVLANEVPYAQTMQETKWAEQAVMVDLFKQKGWRTQFFRNYSGNPSTFGQQMTMFLVNKRLAMRAYSDYMDACIAQARLPYDPQRKPPPVPRDPLASLFSSPFTKAQTRALTNDTANGQLLIMLALQAYQQEHGSYPASLTALTPTYLTKLPDDPFASSGTFKYRRKDNSYLLYSVGFDGKDDGGTSIQKVQQKQHGVPTQITPYGGDGDIVAGVNTF